MVNKMLKVISGGVGNVDRAPGDLSDDDLMRLAAVNRKDAFALLIDRYQSYVFSLATRYLGDRQAGRDVTQDVFLSLWAERHRYRPDGKFQSYLTSVCINRCRVVARGRRNLARKTTALMVETSVAQPKGEEIPLEVLLGMEKRKEIQLCLSKLPDKTRQVMIHRYTHDMSLAEIAVVTGMPVGTVKSHISRGTKRIQQLMGRKR